MYKLFTDGSYVKENKTATIGGYLLDGEDNIVFEFAEKIESKKLSDLLNHEILAIKFGLEKCIAHNIKNLKCYTDDQSLSEKLNVKNENLISGFKKNLHLSRIFELITQFESISFYYIPRKQNKKADFLSKKLNMDYFRNKPTKNFFDNEKLLTKNKYDFNNEKIINYKQKIQKYYIFNKNKHDVTVYEVLKDSKIEILQSYNLTIKNTKEYLFAFYNVLKKSKQNEVGIIFLNNNDEIKKIINKEKQVSDFKNIDHEIKELNNTLNKFKALLINNDSDIIFHLFPEKYNIKEVIKKNENEIYHKLHKENDLSFDNLKKELINKLKEIGEEITIFEKNNKEINGELKDEYKKLIDIQKKYFSKVLSINISEEKIKKRKNQEIVAKDNINYKNNIDNEMKLLKEQLNNIGIKIKF